MMTMIRKIAFCLPSRTVNALALLATGLLPTIATAQAVEAAALAPEVVAEALFLCDSLPPGGRDLNLTVAVQEGEPDAVTGETGVVALPRLQLAMALSERIGFTVDAGFTDAAGDLAFDTPGASLKFLLRDPASGGTGLSASLDLFGSTHSVTETEAGLGVGAIRALGPVTLRASGSLATAVDRWSPHFHTGLSGAVALGSRWRALAEMVADIGDGDLVVSAGPTLKVALGERTALMAGALFEVTSGGAAPMAVVQLTQSL